MRTPPPISMSCPRETIVSRPPPSAAADRWARSCAVAALVLLAAAARAGRVAVRLLPDDARRLRREGRLRELVDAHRGLVDRVPARAIGLVRHADALGADRECQRVV